MVVEPSTTVRMDMAAIRLAVRSSNYFYEQVSYLSNNIGARLSGSPQAGLAVDYVAQQMQALGLAVRLEAVTVPNWRRGKEEARLIRLPLGRAAPQKIVVTALGNTVGTPPEGVMAPVRVVCTFEEFEQLSTSEVEGAVVLFNYAMDEFASRAGRWEQAYKAAYPYRNEGPARAARRGARAALVRSVGSLSARLAHTGFTTFPADVAQIPAAAVTAECADLIAHHARDGEVMIHLLLTPENLPSVQSHNVVADLPGSRFFEEVIIVSGHLDSWDLGTGALDDAAGIAVAMDTLRVIATTNKEPLRTVRFVAWMNEENGRAGGDAYVQRHRSELGNHVAAIELDYGDGRPLGLKVCGTPERLAPISALVSTIAGPFGGVVPVDSSPAVDIAPLGEAGVPTMAPLQDAREYFDYHHTAADTFDKVRPEELRRNLELIAPLTYALAQRD